jgi:hypothetical protein
VIDNHQVSARVTDHVLFFPTIANPFPLIPELNALKAHV